MRICEYDNCGMLVFGTDKKTGKGYCKRHQFARTDTDKRSIAVKAQEKANKARKECGRIFVPEIEEVPVIGGGASLQRWFEDRHKEMTGVCVNCGGRTTKGNPTYWKFSIAHILPKKIFKSVATHPLNFIELCFFGQSCHTNFDNHMIDLIELNCFSEVIDKFVAMYPSIDAKEKRHIPAVLIEYAKIEL